MQLYFCHEAGLKTLSEQRELFGRVVWLVLMVSISLLRKHGQTNNIISIPCNSWNEPGVERFGAKVLKPEKEVEEAEEEEDGMWAERRNNIFRWVKKKKTNVQQECGIHSSRRRTTLCDAINRTAERAKMEWPFYQLEISLSLSAPKTHVSLFLSCCTSQKPLVTFARMPVRSFSSDLHPQCAASLLEDSYLFHDLQMERPRRHYWMLTD